MYERYFGLKRTPFRLESEPDMFFSGENQTRVLKTISSALKQRKGIITLSGLPGTGKTTVIRRAVEAFIAQNTIVCRVNRANTEDILQEIKNELNQRLFTDSSPEQQQEISEIIATAVKERKHVLVVIDEAQQLSKVQIRSLYDLVLSELSLIAYFKFLLIGHENLDELFDLDQMGRREISISEHCQMLPLKSDEIAAYIKHRLNITGWSGNPELKEDIYEYIFRITKGVPRRINSFFDRLLLFSYLESAKSIDIELLKNFSADLYDELESETHPDLDSHDLRQALRCEKKEFENAGFKSKPIPEVVKSPEIKIMESGKTDKSSPKENKPAVAKPNIKLVKSSGKNAENEIKPSKTPLQEKQGQVITLVANYLENPERYKHYSDEFYQLPKDMGLLLELATEKDPVIEKAIPAHLMSLMPHEVRRMIRHFLRKILLTSSEDPYRILGLNASAGEQEINQHFDSLMRICRSDIGGPSEWSKNDENIIKQAYIKILGSNSQMEKAASIPMEPAELIDNDEVPDPEPAAMVAANSIEIKTDKTSGIKKEISHIDSTLDIPKLLKNKAQDDNRKPAIEVPVLINSFEEPTLKLTKVVTKNDKIIPASIAAGVIVIIAILIIVFSGGQEDVAKNDQKELIIPEKKPEYPEIQLLTKDAINKQNLEKQPPKENEENLITKILAQTEAPASEKTVEKPKPSKKESPLEETQIAKPEKAVEPVKKPVVVEKTAVGSTTTTENKLPVKTAATSQPSATEKQPAAKSTVSAPKPVENKTTSAQPAAAQNVVALTDADLGRLIFYFKRSYETGDVSIFGDLFSDDAITNESANREQIVRDYSALFEVTKKRVIELNDLSWNIKGETATGNGKFLLVITENDNTPTEQIQGEISIKAEKIDHKAKIKELFYRYSFAEN